MAFHDFGAGPDDGGLGRHGVTPVGDAAFHRRSGARGRRRRRQGRDRSAGGSAGGRQREGGVGPTCGALMALTLFPEMFPGPLGESLAGKALKEGVWSLEAVDIRRFAKDRHGTVDDAPFGGGAGMVMKPDVLSAAIEAVAQSPGRGSAEGSAVSPRRAVQSGARAGAGRGSGRGAGVRAVRGRRRARHRGPGVGGDLGRRFRAFGRRDRGHGDDGLLRAAAARCDGRAARRRTRRVSRTDCWSIRITQGPRAGPGPTEPNGACRRFWSRAITARSREWRRTPAGRDYAASGGPICGPARQRREGERREVMKGWMR